MTQRLFVYGSLQPGGSNHDVLDGIDGTWEPATVRGRLLEAGWGSGLGYPGLVLDGAGPAVPGAVLTSASLADHWARLDAFEGEDYERSDATVTLASGRTVPVQLYTVSGKLVP
ncbi:MAG: gamma-glutamylcyclotransferase family protein [Pseudomonadota bacterium]